MKEWKVVDAELSPPGADLTGDGAAAQLRSIESSLLALTVEVADARRHGRYAEAARRARTARRMALTVEWPVPGPRLRLAGMKFEWGLSFHLQGAYEEAIACLAEAYDEAAECSGGRAGDCAEHAETWCGTGDSEPAGVAGTAGVADAAAAQLALLWIGWGDVPRTRKWLDRVVSQGGTGAPRSGGNQGGSASPGGVAIGPEPVPQAALITEAILCTEYFDLAPIPALLARAENPAYGDDLWIFLAYTRVLWELLDGQDPVHVQLRYELTVAEFGRISPEGSVIRGWVEMARGILRAVQERRIDSSEYADSVPQEFPMVALLELASRVVEADYSEALRVLQTREEALVRTPRTRLGMLILEAAARWGLEDLDGAVKAWKKACQVAETYRCFAMFGMVQAAVAQDLSTASGSAPGLDNVRYGVFTRSSVSKSLTARELVVVRLLARGLSQGDIAAELVVSPNTVKTQLRSIYRKFGVNKRQDAVAYAVRAGFAAEDGQGS